MADITSYDYDAPMDEAGNPTAKYRTFREIIQKVRFKIDLIKFVANCFFT